MNRKHAPAINNTNKAKKKGEHCTRPLTQIHKGRVNIRLLAKAKWGKTIGQKAHHLAVTEGSDGGNRPVGFF